MSKTKSSKKDLNSYTIKGTNKIVRVGDHVTMRPPDTNKAPYVARVEKIEPCRKNDVKVHVRWYYRPEDSIEGRRRFHGVKELFLSDHYDVQSAHAIEGKCVVHSFKNYTKLQDVAAEDYYYRFEYEAATGTFTPDRVVVYCKCEMPYNPDVLMVQCEECKNWYHPACVDMTAEDAEKLEQYVCSECSFVDEMKKSQAKVALSPKTDSEIIEPKRQRI
ncbi:chromatin remodeling protein EBS-like [Vigna umbellata]|uniref:chromatin remodeling protein EBS n=1 Tax=Phaseolus angularis TaxID=3914 RepID=UPI00080A10FD|nr:chromatin remodeling protein EBS [Vigna angularis]XP_047164657.1 chromatin remodeling protein EBS-like [Vigna umbellata]